MDNQNLPEGWVISTVAEVNYHKSSNVKPADYDDETFELFSVPVFPTGKPEYLIGKDIGSSKQAVESGDVLISKINPRINRVWKVSEKKQFRQIASSEWIVLRQPFMSPDYLLRYFQSDSFRTLLCSDVTGVGGSLTRAQPKKVATYSVPVAPLEEQKVISKKLDKMLAEVETIKAQLTRTLDTLKQFRQSVLAAAVSGKITEEWRKTNDISFDAWEYKPSKKLCEKVQSGSTPRNKSFDQGGKIPFLKVYNIVNQQIDFVYKPQFVTEEVHSQKLKRSIAYPNDVLMNIVGPPLGKVAILTDQYPEWNLNQAITLFRVDQEKLNFKFLYFVLCEGALVRDVMNETKGIVGQVNISLTQCREAIVPKPTLEEQNEIVRQVEALFSEADKIEQQTQAALNRVNQMTQSILAKAFRGELTVDWREQNPDLITGDNSADVLLARIKTGCETLKPAKKTCARKEG